MPLGMDMSGGIMADLVCHQALLISTACHLTSPIDSLRFMKTREQWPVAACLVVYITPQIDVNYDSEASVSAESSTGRGSKLTITIDEWPCLRKEGIAVTAQKAKTCRLKMRSTEISVFQQFTQILCFLWEASGRWEAARQVWWSHYMERQESVYWE